jgi:putative ABC transport system permease protein
VGALLLCEALWLALLASALGLLAAQGLTALLGWLWMADQGLVLGGWHWPPALAGVPLAAVGVALTAAAVPAISAYRVDVTSLLQTR